MAKSTATTILKSATTQTGIYSKLVDINNYPDLGSSPSKLDTTTLSEAKYKTSMLGLQEIPDLTFECNYDEAVYNTLSGMTGTYWFNLCFSTDGVDGIFEWSGQVAVFANGGGVDEVRKMTLTCSASTPITFEVTA